MAALQADPVAHVVEELDRRHDPALKKKVLQLISGSLISQGTNIDI